MFSGSITTSIDIHASPDAVWNAFIAFDTYPAWNPFLIEASVADGGAPCAGAKLDITAKPPGHNPAKFTPLIKACKPSQEFRWLGSLPVPGLFTGEHYFLLEAHSNGTRLVHGLHRYERSPEEACGRGFDNESCGLRLLFGTIDIDAILFFSKPLLGKQLFNGMFASPQPPS